MLNYALSFSLYHVKIFAPILNDFSHKIFQCEWNKNQKQINYKSNVKSTQNMRTIASAFRNNHKFGLPEFSWHSLYKTKHVPHVKTSKVPITN